MKAFASPAYQRTGLGVSQTLAPAHAHLDHAHARTSIGELDAARYYARLAANTASQGWERALELGVLSFELGEFHQAFHFLQDGSRTRHPSGKALRMLAALYHRHGDKDLARKRLAELANREPVTGPPAPDPSQPNVMRLRSFEKSRFGIKTDRATGLRTCRLKGGHFSLRNLIDQSRLNLYVGTSFEDSLSRTENIPEIDLFINCVSCADLDPDGLDAIEAFLKHHPSVPVINPPAKVRRTTRGENARRLGSLPDVIMPPAKLYDLDADPRSVAEKVALAGAGGPLIVRESGTQTGKSVELVGTLEALCSWLDARSLGTRFYAIPFIDCRGSDGFFHKMRAFFIDGTFYPVANLTSDSWQIHSGDRYRVMSSSQASQAEEVRYLQDPKTYLGSKAYQALHSIRDTVDLDFFGIDFALDGQGRVVVFEANAAMRHNFDHADNFPYTRPYLQTISDAFADMVQRRAGHSV